MTLASQKEESERENPLESRSLPRGLTDRGLLLASEALVKWRFTWKVSLRKGSSFHNSRPREVCR